VNQLLSQSEEILDVAAAADSNLEAVILIDRQGGLRMMEPTGWSFPGLAAEFGAVAIFRIERRSTGVRVEGWNSSQRCLLERDSQPATLTQLPGIQRFPSSAVLQLCSGAAA